jgi:hypothetical protein
LSHDTHRKFPQNPIFFGKTPKHRSNTLRSEQHPDGKCQLAQHFFYTTFSDSNSPETFFNPYLNLGKAKKKSLLCAIAAMIRAL